MENLKHILYDYLLTLGVNEIIAEYLNMLGLLIVLLILITIIDYVLRKIIINSFNVIALKSKTRFDNILVHNKAPRNIAHIFPLYLAIKAIPIIFKDFPDFGLIIKTGLQVFGVILSLWIARSVLHSLKDYLKTIPRFKDKPIDSYIQVFMIFAWVIGIFMIFAIVSGISFWEFITTIGAGSAIIILVFRDSILGFVASIQVTVNDMVRIGDWITFEKYGADGDVTEINLSTVKVQNFDKTTTTIPTYALISDSFKNWRGMSDSGGRRIKRSIIIKASSVHYLTDDDVENLKKIQLISDYLTDRKNDIDKYNHQNEIDKSVLINGRNLTNLGVFRKYIQSYIENHSAINKDMTIMTRQLAPTSQGLPLEIYAFSSDKRWVNYEYIISDIFDHSLAAVPYFDLELFELPTEITNKAK
ncbi:mechanosensitive ion channel family protein [Oceanihabitans sediminis]|uniref:Mechanosensitive ion channel family protein n=1 Tax=Oceanihabitans sediminis TaxID=1812012 RepID=A0A368P6H0_9FLAO|nr:mechanosensitive ion channel family protein [Oceanihabitans sediminis]MDX1277248.1 mechanosensitive ion channel family protein [Oceanihabitans sediminis]MDX1773667.1 mechanosensitive ion channel family protein [Oceanihabitans sediminis]RBP33111.1 miniconductance mechanosensitive channel [Oceanihabitans sediminis]RCU57379.1 mechanosensitive ion channel family protein [Oceanihabitans sediminis]